jgi:predicted nucleic acid-binding protein
MILCDTSVWIDHFRRGEPHLVELLEGVRVLMHPFVLGELACGSLADRRATLDLLAKLPGAPHATQEEALAFIESRELFGRGIGYVDVHLLASTVLAGAELWTRDRHLGSIAAELGVAHAPSEGGRPMSAEKGLARRGARLIDDLPVDVTSRSGT